MIKTTVHDINSCTGKRGTPAHLVLKGRSRDMAVDYQGNLADLQGQLDKHQVDLKGNIIL